MSLSKIQIELRQRMKPVQRQTDGSFSSSITFDREFCGFDGHFPDNPIVPAVCLLSAAELLAAEAVGCPLKLQEISTMKFKQHLVPGDIADFSCQLTKQPDGVYSASVTITTNEQRTVAKLLLLLTK
jgi:3-hydroxyacyl-[acyl-carrier-protein] dehydratase